MYVHELATGQRRGGGQFRLELRTGLSSRWAKHRACAHPRRHLNRSTSSRSPAARRYACRAAAPSTPSRSSPDGRHLYYPDRGSPQIYRMPASGGAAERITFEGEYNVSPDVSSDGKLLTFVTSQPGGVTRWRCRFADATAAHSFRFARRVAFVRAQWTHDRLCFRPGGRGSLRHL